MTQQLPHPVPESAPVLRAGIYWRRGVTVTPGVMTLADGRLSFVTDAELVFDAPVAEVAARFTHVSTLTVLIAGRSFVFVTGAYAGAFARSFSPAQLALLAGASNGEEALRQFQDGASIIVSSSVAASAARIAGSVLARSVALVGDAVGVVDLYRSQAQSFALARAWAETLAAGGVPVRMLGSSFGRSQLVVAAIVLPVLVVIGLLAWALAAVLT